MKMRAVTVDIPEDKEVTDKFFANNNKILCLCLSEEMRPIRRPMEIIFKEVMGRDYICHGEYYTNSMHHLPQFFVAEDPHFAPKVKITDPNIVVWHLGRG